MAAQDIYNIDGILLRRAATSADLATLTPGIYLLRSAGKTLKVTLTK